MSIQYEDSNITMKYLKRVYPYITNSMLYWWWGSVVYA